MRPDEIEATVLYPAMKFEPGWEYGADVRVSVTPKPGKQAKVFGARCRSLIGSTVRIRFSDHDKKARYSGDAVITEIDPRGRVVFVATAMIVRMD